MLFRSQYAYILRPTKMAAILQTTLSYAFYWMIMFQFRLKNHWILFLKVQLIRFQHWFRYWLDTDWSTSHFVKQRWLDYWRIYASLGLSGWVKFIQSIGFHAASSTEILILPNIYNMFQQYIYILNARAQTSASIVTKIKYFIINDGNVIMK